VTYTSTGTILDAILERSAADLQRRKSEIPANALMEIARTRSAPVSLRASLSRPGISVIAEIKRASPSRGRFPVEVDPASVAAEYAAGGAAAISVLTDEPYFLGSLDDLEAAAEIAHAEIAGIPVLRKDFVVDPYQVIEARASGADAVLLIVGALDDALLRELVAIVDVWGMEALVEVHDEAEMTRAATAGAKVIGINNRDLKTFHVDLAVTERLAPLAQEGAVIVAESGIFGPDDAKRLASAGADAILVGEGLITAPDRAEALRALRA
jgi:indole-3-glycerol phosphate synthase